MSDLDHSRISHQDIRSELLLIRQSGFRGVQIGLETVDSFVSRLEALHEIESGRGQLAHCTTVLCLAEGDREYSNELCHSSRIESFEGRNKRTVRAVKYVQSIVSHITNKVRDTASRPALASDMKAGNGPDLKPSSPVFPCLQHRYH